MTPSGAAGSAMETAAPRRVRPQSEIRAVAVLGAGTMGAQLAAQIANAGMAVRLFDVDRATARAGLERAAQRRPDPFFSASVQRSIEFGGFETDRERLADADWIVEAVIEQPDAKRALLEIVDRHRTPGTPTSTNTSSLSVAALAEGRSEDFRRCWLGTHFFNPPRHMHLVELVPTEATEPSTAARVARFCDLQLGKGVVVARDTPGFIANRLGIFDMLQALRVLASGQYSVDAIDRMSGSLIGRPASAIFRTLDMVGLDVAAAAISAIGARLSVGDAAGASDGADGGGVHDELFAVPPILQDMIDRGWLGNKTGRGFYATSAEPHLDSAAAAPLVAAPPFPEGESLGCRLKRLFLSQDETGAYLRDTMGRTLVYAAEMAPRLAASIDDIDRAMRWGYGWALGPFEIWDAIGIDAVVGAMKLETVPSAVGLLRGQPGDRIRVFHPVSDAIDIAGQAIRTGRVRRSSSVGRISDLGDGVFHAQLMPQRTDLLDVAHFVEGAVADASASGLALIIHLDGTSIDRRSAVRELLLNARAHAWDRIDQRLLALQRLGRFVHDAEIPIVVCANGRLTSEGCALTLHAVRVQAGAELRLGFVDTDLGLIPATGGTTAMVTRALRHANGDRPDLVTAMRPGFDLIRSATVATSARHSRALGLLRPRDGVTMNPDRLTLDAKAAALVEISRLKDGPTRRRMLLAGGDNLSAALKLSVHLAQRAGRISDHDARVARALATVVAGGSHAQPREGTEEEFFDLEREAFLGLCGEAKTLDRLEHFVATGRPLRN